MNIAKNFVVSLDFRLTDDQGTLLDESEEGTPLVYLHGAAGIVPGLEKELEGKVVGDRFSATLTPEEGFGVSRPELIRKTPLSSFPDPSLLHTGMRIQGVSETSGQATDFVVREITEDQVVLDSNHPLAGMTLRFEGVVQDIREATDEEIRQGHPL